MPPSIWTLIAQLLLFLEQYGPVALPILAKAWGFIKAHDWAGLAAYIESILINPPFPIPAPKLQELKVLGDWFKAHSLKGTVLP